MYLLWSWFLVVCGRSKNTMDTPVSLNPDFVLDRVWSGISDLFWLWNLQKTWFLNISSKNTSRPMPNLSKRLLCSKYGLFVFCEESPRCKPIHVKRIDGFVERFCRKTCQNYSIMHFILHLIYHFSSHSKNEIIDLSIGYILY